MAQGLLKKMLMGGVAASILAVAGIAQAAEIKVGVVLSQTGSAANFSQSIEGAIRLWPTEFDGHTLNMIYEDDRTDITTATTIVRRLLTDEKVDVLVGPVVTPMTVAAAPLANEAETVLIAMAPVPLDDTNMKWVFNVTPPAHLMGGALVADMAKRGVKTVGVIGYSDTWGDQWLKQVQIHGEEHGIEVIADERYGRSDTSVTGQALKLISLNPDAILVAASYAGAALPQVELVERGYSGKIYQTQGIDRKSFMSAAGDSAEGVLFPVGPGMLADALPEDAPTRELSRQFVNDFEANHGPDTYSSSGAHGWDAFHILKAGIVEATKKAEPGTAEFRSALRDAIEGLTDVVGSNGVYTFTADDHWGLRDDRSVVMATVKDGKWQLAD